MKETKNEGGRKPEEGKKKMGGGGPWEANTREETEARPPAAPSRPPCRPDRGCSCPFTLQVGPPCTIYEEGICCFSAQPTNPLQPLTLTSPFWESFDSQQSILNQPNDLAFISDHFQYLTLFHHFPVRGSFLRLLPLIGLALGYFSHHRD